MKFLYNIKKKKLFIKIINYLLLNLKYIYLKLSLLLLLYIKKYIIIFYL